MNYQYRLDWNDFIALQLQQLFNIGAAIEQFAAQHLMYVIDQERKPELYYWIREKKSANV